MYSMKSKSESLAIYKVLQSSLSLKFKYQEQACFSSTDSIQDTLAVLLNDGLLLSVGSSAEGTDITPSDYNTSLSHNLPTICFSDKDLMAVLYDMRVIEEGEALPPKFDNHMYCRAERGRHTAEGFRKLRVIHQPEKYTLNQDIFIAWFCAVFLNLSVENGYISSAKLLALVGTLEVYLPYKIPLRNAFVMKGPSNIIEFNGSPADFVNCFHVKTWPKEADSWFTRQTQWPDKQLKNQIKKTGYLLVPTGNSKSQENYLEWRCSFSIAEKILFKNVTKFQRYTFIMLKVLMKEYMPSEINTDGKKQLLSTYHMKTVFLWCLENSKLKWEPENMLHIIGHRLDVLMKWIKKEDFPHYFINSINLFDDRQFHGKKTSVKRVISSIRNDLSNKIRQSRFFRSQEICGLDSKIISAQLFVSCLLVMKSFTGILQHFFHRKVFQRIHCSYRVKFSHILLIEVLLSVTFYRDIHMEHLCRVLNTDPLHDKLLTEVVPGLIDQYRGCIHLAKYCTAKRDGCIYPKNLHVAKTLLKDTLRLDPCSGYLKLACLYIVTGDFVQAIELINVAEHNFLYTHKILKGSTSMASERKGVEVDRIITDFIQEVFLKWVEGKVTSDIVVTWLEYIIAPNLLQFELVHESTHQVIDIPYRSKRQMGEFHVPGLQGKMVELNCQLEWPPLSIVKLLKFVCAFNSGQYSTSYLKELVADLIASSLSVTVAAGFNDIYTVFNMATWCYVKIRKFRQAAHIMSMAIVTRSEDKVISEADLLKRCAFCHHFTAYIIAQCLL